MSRISPIEILANGMAAARMRVNTLASNIANAETTRTADGGPYKRRDVVQVAHSPGHPDADKNGFVAYPNINVVQTMTDLLSASRLYQANVTAVETARNLQSEASKILTQA
jgi:flagellar basal-body rod protein FlgC